MSEQHNPTNQAPLQHKNADQIRYSRAKSFGHLTREKSDESDTYGAPVVAHRTAPEPARTAPSDRTGIGREEPIKEVTEAWTFFGGVILLPSGKRSHSRLEYPLF